MRIALECPDIVEPDTRAALFAIAITNVGPGDVVLDEIHDVDLDLPDQVTHSSAANASFHLIRLYADPIEQGYSCQEMTAPPPTTRRLKPGETYRYTLSLPADGLEAGEYEARAGYDPAGLTTEPCRFRVLQAGVSGHPPGSTQIMPRAA